MALSQILQESDVERYLRRWTSVSEYLVIGSNIKRIDALEKLKGTARYVGDYRLEDLLHIKIVRSTCAHGLIKKIDISETMKLSGIVGVFTARDIPGTNEIGYTVQDQPLLANGKVRFVGEPIALIAADDPNVAVDAVDTLDVEYEELPTVFSIDEARKKSNVLIHEERGSNIAACSKVRRGNIEAGFDGSYVVLEKRYKTPYQDTVAIEPPAALAIPESLGRLSIISSLQYPHLCQKITSRVLGIPASSIRIVQAVVGGAFGAKDDMAPITSAMAGLVTLKTGQPSVLVYSREEAFTSQCKREPSEIRYKSGVSRDGKIRAIDVEILLDCGAYANRAPYVLWRATMHASGPYEVPNARIDGFSIYTNKVFQGSFRGFGNPQVQFAVECQMDSLAAELGMDPIEFRLRNVFVPGSKTITGQVLDHSVGITEVLTNLREYSGWDEKRRADIASTSDGNKKLGIGVACAWHGISTSKGAPDWSNAYVNVLKDGSVACYTGIAELGQGTHTGHAQIVSEILGIPTKKVQIYGGTTDAPDTGATHASRGTSIGGTGVLIACSRIRERLARLAGRMLHAEVEELEFRDGMCRIPHSNRGIQWEALIQTAYESGIDVTSTGYFFVPKGSFNEETGQGTAYPAFSFCANIAEVLVDLETGMVEVLRIWPGLAAGKILNPLMVEAQLQGAALQGMGYGLTEELVFQEGTMLNSSLLDYLIPCSLQTPKIEKPIYVEDVWKLGPFGAKGVAEMAMISIAPAITNAIQNATGVKIHEIPVSPNRMLSALGAKNS